MQITSRVDYAVRALLHIAAADPVPVGTPRLAEVERLPPKFLAAILADLRRSGFLYARRGTSNPGFMLARPASTVTVGDVIRAQDGGLQGARGVPLGSVVRLGPAANLDRVWQATDAAIFAVLDAVTLADLGDNRLPAGVQWLVPGPDLADLMRAPRRPADRPSSWAG